MRIIKKIAAAAAACAVMLTAGCSQEGSGENVSNTAQREKIRIWSYYETQAQRQGMDELLKGFNQSQNLYEASWEYYPMTGFNKKLSSAFAENDLPDMAILDNPDMPVMIRLGIFEEITEQVEEWNEQDAFYPAIIKTAEYEGGYYGVPFNCNNTALIYNKDMLEEAGIEPPETWDELREAAKCLTTQERTGFLMCGIEGEQGAFQILPWILAAGEEPQDLGGEKTKEAFAFLQSLIEDGSLSESCINLTQTDVARQFMDGRAAIIQNGPWVFPMIEDAGISYGVIEIPCRDGENPSANAVVGGENIGILKGKNKEGSLAFIRYFMEEASADFCRKANVLPGNEGAAQKMAAGDENMQVFEKQMHTAVTRTSIERWPAISKALTDGLFQLVAREKTPEEIAKSFNPK